MFSIFKIYQDVAYFDYFVHFGEMNQSKFCLLEKQKYLVWPVLL